MPLSSSGSEVSDRSQGRSAQDSDWLPNSDAHSPVAACTSCSGGTASRDRNTGSVK